MSTYIIYKPYGMLSQFTREVPSHITLADLDYTFESDVYPVGRLDADSEGLLILTNDKSLNNRLLNPKNKSPKTYLIQVEGKPSKEAIEEIAAGVTIRIKGKSHQTQPCLVSILDYEPILPDRNPPIRVRRTIPTTWLSITLTEGKNRQVRRMLAVVNHPVLRLVRSKIWTYELNVAPLNLIKSGAVVKL